VIVPASCKLAEAAHFHSVQPSRKGFKWEVFRLRAQGKRSSYESCEEYREN
jgi:hypothetical protein